MTESTIRRAIERGEDIDVEFKEAKTALPRSLFQSVGAFLNQDGGTVLLGVEDNGDISGVDPDSVDKLRRDIANLSNNPEKLDPPYLLFPHALELNGKWVIQIQVPASSQVHRADGDVYLRSEDGDYRVKDLRQIAGIVNRKLSFFTEQRVYPHLKLSHFREDLIARAQEMMLARNPQHTWANLPLEELFQKAGFLREDAFSGTTGFTLAAVLMFGTDEIIGSVAPAYKFDALLRRKDLFRYDDRLLVRTNLIDAYDLLMGFVEKHLDDPFFLEGNVSVSLRSKIFRELVANIIAHREYTNAAPATMVIYEDRVEFKNPNVPHGHGPINPTDFTPHPKNPTICKFMLQLGRFEELGSGVINVSRYLPHYAEGALPQFLEEQMFTAIIPIAGGDQNRGTGNQKSNQKSNQKILELLKAKPLLTIHELAELLAMSVSGVKKQIAKLKVQGELKRIGPDKGGHWEVVERDDDGGRG
ncbi:MAG: winged helix-turn-helix transcriptional regulator [Verrucomicrobia bacterium]|jgi:ATP-dependent DNA helicase RecG|nr:winged helix-turn-helix transcriptional regulator [Verrucomicrobiota bacterium]